MAEGWEHDRASCDCDSDMTCWQLTCRALRARVAELESQRDHVDQQLADMRAAQLQVDASPNRRCGFCGLAKTPEGHDGCLGTLPGVMNACCGHGRPHEAYIQFKDGSRIADVHGLMSELADNRATIAEQAATIERLRMELKWYADPGNFRHLDCCEELRANSVYERARRALAELVPREASTRRGHRIVDSPSGWIYADTQQLVYLRPDRDCGFCGRPTTPEGHDGCLGTLPGVMNACCGHGRPHEAYIQFKDGSRIADVHGLMSELADNRATEAERRLRSLEFALHEARKRTT